jgi:hypothetical protein
MKCLDCDNPKMTFSLGGVLQCIPCRKINQRFFKTTRARLLSCDDCGLVLRMDTQPNGTAVLRQVSPEVDEIDSASDEPNAFEKH